MRFVDFNAEVVLYSLNSHVLSERSELVVKVQVVGRLVFPFRLQELQGLFEHGFGSNFSRVRSTRQPVVVLFHCGASSLDSEMSGHFVEVHSVRLILKQTTRGRIACVVQKFGLDFSLQRLLQLKLF